MTNPRDIATGFNIGAELLDALGLSSMSGDKSRWITRLVIDIQANKVVTVQVTEEMRVGNFEHFIPKLTEYKLVPKDE